jgi:hypothetical protein
MLQPRPHLWQNLIPAISLLAQPLILRVQTRHSLPRNAARDPTLEHTTDSSPSQSAETLILFAASCLVQAVDREPLRARVRVLAISQIRPPRHDDRVLEFEPFALGVLAHLDLNQILCRTLRAASRWSASVATGDDEIRMRGFARNLRGTSELVFVRVRRLGDV